MLAKLAAQLFLTEGRGPTRAMSSPNVGT